jgi:hypothetical protein
MRNYFLAVAFLIANLATIVAPNSAQAAAIPIEFNGPVSTYDFFGTCSDCTGTGVAHLTLQNYTAGTAIQHENFLSFKYDGSDLMDPYSILLFAHIGPFLQSVRGMMPSSQPGPFEFSITDGLHYFTTSIDGSWDTGRAGPINVSADYGINGTWSAQGIAATVPEPTMMALLGIGLAGFGLSRRRRTQRCAQEA